MGRYFISYSGADEKWARWIAEQIRSFGHETVVQAEDCGAGSNFVVDIDEALRGMTGLVSLLSPAYIKSRWCREEWARILKARVDGKKLDWVLLRVAHVDPPGLLDGIVYLDLVGQTKSDATESLRAHFAPAATAARGGAFPGTARFPGGSPLHGVPRPTDTFVGREAEVAELRRCLTRTGGAVSVAAALDGLAGVGKTELAAYAAFAFAAEDLFPGGIFWLSAENPDLRGHWGGFIGDHLKAVGDTLDARASDAIRRINGQSARTLVILDNVASWERDKRPSPLPEGAHVAILATTRRSRLSSTFHHVGLKVLPRHAAEQLVLAVADRELSSAPGFSDLMQHLDGHALACELAGATLREFPELTPRTYLEHLHSGRDPAGAVAGTTNYERTVKQAFDTLWARVDDATQDAWLLAACFAPEPVDPAFSDTVGLDAAARHSLRRFHLIDDLGDGVWKMHRLTAAFASAVDAARAEAVAARFIDGIAKEAKKIDQSLGFRIYLASRPHFDEAIGRGRKLTPRPSCMSSIETYLGRAHCSLGFFESARDLYQAALDADLRNHGPDSPAVAIRRSNLATVLQDLGDPASAKTHLEAALASDLRTFGAEHPKVAIRRSNLALVLKDLGDLAGAKTHLEAALASDLRTFGENHPEVATDRSNLALVLQDLGDLAGAKAHLEAALASGLRTFGEDHPKVAIRRSNLAAVVSELAKRSEETTAVAETAAVSDTLRHRIQRFLKRAFRRR